MCIDHFVSGKVTRLQLTMKLHIIVGDVLKSELPFFNVCNCIANSCRTRSPHLSCSSCCCCCIETSITVPKEGVPVTPVNQLHHVTNRTNQATRHELTPSRQPIPDSAIRCRQRRQRTCTSHASVRRALPSRAATHNTVTRTGTYFRCAKVLRILGNAETFLQHGAYGNHFLQLAILNFGKYPQYRI